MVNESKYAYISPKFMVNVGKYTIHGACGKESVQAIFFQTKTEVGAKLADGPGEALFSTTMEFVSKN